MTGIGHDDSSSSRHEPANLYIANDVCAFPSRPYPSTSSGSSEESQFKVPEQHHPPRNSTDTKREPEKPRLWQSGEPYRFAPRKIGEPWEELMKEVKKYDKEEVEGWREDIDTLLVFAGLFSAAVTAFTVESYQWLQRDPMDATTQLLYQISLQLANSTFSAAPNPSQQKFTPESSSVRINTLWFLSLILGLSSALLSILCKQWLREYCRDTHTKTQMQALVLRQLRYTSFQKWHVRTFITCLPLLLELALLLFFAGILELLWTLHSTVAALVTGVVGCTVIFFFVTAMLPTYSFANLVPEALGSLDPEAQAQKSDSDLEGEFVTFCPYKSPLAWLFFRLFQVIYSHLKPSSKGRFSKITNWSRGDLEIIKDSPYHNTAWGYYYDHEHLQLLDSGLKWTVDAFGDSARMAGHIFHCLSSLEVTLPPDVYHRSLGSIFEVSKYTDSGSMTAEEVPSQTIFRFLDHRYEEVNNVFLGELTLRALNEASKKTPKYVFQYLQSGFFYIMVLFKHALSVKSESPEVLHEVIHQTQACISNSISSHIESKSSNNIHSLVLTLCEEMASYKDASVDEGILTIFDHILKQMEEELHLRPLLWIRPHLLDVICNFIFRQGGFSLTDAANPEPLIPARFQNVLKRLKNLLVNDSLQWETLSVYHVSPGSSGEDRAEWEEFWDEYLRKDYILPNANQ